MAATNLVGTLCIRADANEQIGIGHVMRCLSLAQAWRELGGSVVFASQPLPSALSERLESEGVLLHAINAEAGSTADALATVGLATKSSAEWLVVDGYCFSSEFLLILKAGGCLVFGQLELDWHNYVEIDPRYFRPAEVDLLLGNASKAKQELGWTASTDVRELARIMVEYDLDLAQRELHGRSFVEK